MAPAEQTLVIVGAGLAGAKAAETLRSERFDGRIVLIGDEPERPYDRPPLSKDYLLGKSEKEKIYLHPKGWYVDHGVDLRLDTRVASIDRDAHEVIAEGGERVGYHKLLLTTGSSPRRLAVPGNDLDGVFYLRRVADSEAIKSAFAAAKRVAIIGAGWIGLETAAAARAAGCEVTIVEMAELPLAVLGPEVAEVYATLHRDHGVDLRLGVKVAEITADNGKASGVQLGDGSVVGADAVVVGVGIIPNTDLATVAGLTVDNGVVVDEHMATSDPDIFAAGDVASAYYPLLGTHLRLEHWQAALHQGPVAAANMVDRILSYDQVPYFFSDQYDMGMEYSGYVAGGRYDQVVFRGDVTKREFIAFWMEGERVLAGMNVNIWDSTDDIQNLVRTRRPVNPAALADPNVSLKDVQGSALGAK